MNVPGTVHVRVRTRVRTRVQYAHMAIRDVLGIKIWCNIMAYQLVGSMRPVSMEEQEERNNWPFSGIICPNTRYPGILQYCNMKSKVKT